jgi:hypothetical protein
MTESENNASAGFVGVRPRVLTTVGYLFDVNFHYQLEDGLLPLTDGIEGLISRWEPPLLVDSHPDLRAKIEAKYPGYEGECTSIGFSGIEELVKRCEVTDCLEAFRDSAVEELQSSSGLDRADQRHLQSKIQVMDELIEFFENEGDVGE